MSGQRAIREPSAAVGLGIVGCGGPAIDVVGAVPAVPGLAVVAAMDIDPLLRVYLRGRTRTWRQGAGAGSSCQSTNRTWRRSTASPERSRVGRPLRSALSTRPAPRAWFWTSTGRPGAQTRGPTDE